MVAVKSPNITNRTTMWLGQICNARCQFCFFINAVNDKSHPHHGWMDREKAFDIFKTVRNHFGNEYIDLQGGEPTIYPHIYGVIYYCSSIGLKPRTISNGLRYAKIEFCKHMQSCGLDEVILSVQGYQDNHNKAVGVKGAWDKIGMAVHNFQELGIPYRFNTVLTYDALLDLESLIDWSIEARPDNHAFLIHCPFEDWWHRERESGRIPTMGYISEKINRAIVNLRSAGITSKIRYMPHCLIDENNRHCSMNFHQLPYDRDEWDYSSWDWTQHPLTRALHGQNPQARPRSIWTDEDYDARSAMKRDVELPYCYSKKCKECLLKTKCDGLHQDYMKYFGDAELRPVLSDPTHPR